MAVFASNEILIEINTAAVGETVNFVELIETKGISKTDDVNVDERDVYNSVFTKRTVTGGKKMDFSFETTMSVGNSAHDFLRTIVFSTDMSNHNDQKIRLTFPLFDNSHSTKRTETYTGVIKPTADGGQGAVDLSVLNFDFMSSFSPEIEQES